MPRELKVGIVGFGGAGLAHYSHLRRHLGMAAQQRTVQNCAAHAWDEEVVQWR